jgi:phosphomethylpyrimidine synthase
MALSDVSASLSVTTGPIVGSRKYYRDLDRVPSARVPFRR